MNTLTLSQATAWLSERVPDAQLADFAAMLAIGSAPRALPLASLGETLGTSQAWVDAFVRRQATYRGGISPFIEIRHGGEGDTADLSSAGRNLLNQFWQRARSSPGE